VALTAAPTARRAGSTLQIARLLLDRGPQPVQARALVGDPGAALAGASDGLDVIVCGSRGRGQPVSPMLGRVAEHLVTYAHCPVLVVPPSAATVPGGPLGVTPVAAGR
jgi:nucleotide-binding universal stress UspA family protein